MQYIALPDNSVRHLSFYLAMEEYAARYLNTGEDLFFSWRVKPTVIFGRNQLIENEINIDYCREKGIEMYRRKSGGGCVYADMSNVMTSYITREENVNLTYNRYVTMICMMLAKLGIDAKASGRNDIMTGGRKISGTAFYHIPGHSIVHGTMLFDTDMTNMLTAITPSKEKLNKNGVESVRQRIGLLKDYTNISIEEFMDFARKTLCDSTITLTESGVSEIENIEKGYLSNDFIFAK